MNRRSRRSVLGLVTATALAGCTTDSLPSLGESNDMHGPRQEYGIGSPGFASAGWTEDGQFEVVFEEDHGIEGWGIRYHAHESFRDDIVLQEAPDFGEAVSIDLFEAFNEYDSRPPAGEYQIIAYEGNFGEGINLVGDPTGRVSFHIVPGPVVSSPRVTEDYQLAFTAENTGNSPCRLDSIVIEGTPTAVDEMLLHGEQREIVSEAGIFPPDEDDEDCMELLNDFTAEVLTTPRVQTTVEVSTDFESERVCETATI